MRKLAFHFSRADGDGVIVGLLTMEGPVCNIWLAYDFRFGTAVDTLMKVFVNTTKKNSWVFLTLKLLLFPLQFFRIKAIFLKL